MSRLDAIIRSIIARTSQVNGRAKQSKLRPQSSTIAFLTCSSPPRSLITKRVAHRRKTRRKKSQMAHQKRLCLHVRGTKIWMTPLNNLGQEFFDHKNLKDAITYGKGLKSSENRRLHNWTIKHIFSLQVSMTTLGVAICLLTTSCCT